MAFLNPRLCRLLTAALFGSTIALSACTPATDTCPEGSTDPACHEDHDHDHDAGNGQDAGHDHGDHDLDFNPGDVTAQVGETEAHEHLWNLQGVDDGIIINVEMYEQFGARTTPGEVELEGDELNYATCGTCVLMRTGCEAHGDHFHCDHTFMATGGHVDLEAIGTAEGETLAGALHDIGFQEVTIDSETYQSTPVADGETYELDAWDFDVTLEAMGHSHGGGGDEECGGHGHLHGDHCHCDDGYVQDPNDASQCIPE